MKKEFKFKIGADPEFNLIMQNRKVDARQTMQFILSQKRNLKKTNDDMGYDIKNFGNIGWDGMNETAEIRPKPSNTPQGLINNLAGILKETGKHLNLFDMSTISEFGPIGGHIHFEVPKEENWSDQKRNALHRKMASFYLPVLISENKINLNLRIRQGYGSLKDNRLQKLFKHSDGTDGYTYEFRCPSAEWMTTPKIALATISYLAVIYHEILNKPKSFAKYSDVIYKSDKQGDALQTLAIMEFSLLTKQIMNKIKKYIKNFEMYDSYKAEINYLFNSQKVLKDKGKVDYNINIGWNSAQNAQTAKKHEILSSKKKFQKLTKEKNLDELKKIMNVHFNDDTNVVLFAETFKDRVAAFNWKLKNNYFIFGMRKGINQIVAKNLMGDFLAGKETIKTRLDLASINDLFLRMQNKFNSNTSCSANTAIDFKTGKPKNQKMTLILIGLPYETRIAENTKSFLELIWNIEKEKTQNMIISGKEEQLLDDTSLPPEQQGEIHQILTHTAPQPPVIYARESSSQRSLVAQVAREITQEQPNELDSIPEPADEETIDRLTANLNQ